MTDWQDISTAPRDGTWIFAYAPDTLHNWSPPAPWVLIQWVRRWDNIADSEAWFDESISECEPTHWMPLPQPPESEA